MLGLAFQACGGIRKNMTRWLSLSAFLIIVASLVRSHLACVLAGPLAVSPAQTLVSMTNTWRYNQGTDLGRAWRESHYSDTNWPIGNALFFVEDDPLPAPKNTPLEIGAITYYFRTTFFLHTNLPNLHLVAHTVVDDGLVAYLNGSEVLRLFVAPGEVHWATRAGRDITDAFYEGPFSIPTDSLQDGENSLAVEVHQSSANSPDVVFGMVLEATYDPEPDTDKDGMPDAWEVAHGLDPADPGDAAADADHDGLTNLQEYRAGTDPRDASSVLTLRVIDWHGGQIGLVFIAVGGRSYSIQNRSNSASEWVTMTNFPAQAIGGMIGCTERVTAGSAQRFYRVVTPAEP